MRKWLIVLALLGELAALPAAPVLKDAKGKEIKLWEGDETAGFFLKADPKKMELLYSNLTLGPIILKSDTVRSAEELRWSCALINTYEGTEALEIPPIKATKKDGVKFWVGHCVYKLERLGPSGMDVAKYKAPASPDTYNNPGAIPAGHGVVQIWQKAGGGLTSTFLKVNEIDWKAETMSIRPKESIVIDDERRSGLGLATSIGTGTYELSLYYCTQDGRLLAVQRALFSIGSKLRNSKADGAAPAAKSK